MCLFPFSCLANADPDGCRISETAEINKAVWGRSLGSVFERTWKNVHVNISHCQLWHSWGFEMPPAPLPQSYLTLRDLYLRPARRSSDYRQIWEKEIWFCQNLQIFPAESPWVLVKRRRFSRAASKAGDSCLVCYSKRGCGCGLCRAEVTARFKNAHIETEHH